MPKVTPFVPLDADYFDNPRIIAAGEKAELLYVRGLAKAKLLLSDGVLLDAHVERLGLSGVRQRAKALVDAGLWERSDGGFYIVGWLERNAPAESVLAGMGAKREAGILGNHTRWHGDRSDPTCPHCAIAPAIAGATTVRLPKTETEKETEKTPLPPTSGGTDASQPRRQGRRSDGTSPRQIADALREQQERGALLEAGTTWARQQAREDILRHVVVAQARMRFRLCEREVVDAFDAEILRINHNERSAG